MKHTEGKQVITIPPVYFERSKTQALFRIFGFFKVLFAFEPQTYVKSTCSKNPQVTLA